MPGWKIFPFASAVLIFFSTTIEAAIDFLIVWESIGGAQGGLGGAQGGHDFFESWKHEKMKTPKMVFCPEILEAAPSPSTNDSTKLDFRSTVRFEWHRSFHYSKRYLILKMRNFDCQKPLAFRPRFARHFFLKMNTFSVWHSRRDYTLKDTWAFRLKI